MQAGFDLLTWRKGPAPDLPADTFTTITCADDRGREHAYDLADTTITLGIHDGPRKGQTVSLRQVTRRVPARGGGTRQIHALTSRTDLPAGEVCWRLTSRWREENYFRYARTHFALDALDSHAATPDDPARLVPNPARKTAAAQARHAEILAAAAQAERDASLAALAGNPMRRNLGRPRAHSRSVRVGVPWRLAGDPLITGQYAPRRRSYRRTARPYRLGVRVADDVFLSRIR
jgi:hypothetical protein